LLDTDLRMSALTDSAEWRDLQHHAKTLSQATITGLFEPDGDRAKAFSAEGAGLFLDYSKQRADAGALDRLYALAARQDLAGWIQRLFAGEPINRSEGRAAAHWALRAPRGQATPVAGQDVSGEVHGVLDRMAVFADQVRGGQWLGASGKPITDVVNIGIGGSDLGPRMVCRALQRYASGPRVHFVANVDGADLTEVLHGLEPATALFIIASKTFTTLETMTNAQAARRWLVAALGDAATPKHFVAVSTNEKEVEKFGIDTANMFGFWDWVGGRYSLWSAIGLPIVIALGPQRFRELLDGAHAMDEHFRTAPLRANLPVLMGLLAVWNANFLGAPSQVCAPYAQDLEYFVAWLQQLEMESNGKGVDREGRTVDYATTPAQWGNVGTNGQHAFFQMLHQGPAHHPVDFVLPLRGGHDLPGQQRILIANCLAQSAALMKGKTAQQVRDELQAKGLPVAELEAAVPPRVFTGGRPSNTILLPQLDAWHLGALLALYEHRTFVEGVLWNINSFDQWGVELGKQLAQSVLKAMDGGDRSALDPSTRALLARAAASEE
jgi:glucose-6-phosphate isomerase